MFNFFKNKSHSELKVIITGEPRSGTSFLSGYINKMGFNLGKKRNIKSADKNNRYGYFEHKKLMQVSKNILIKMNADYHWEIPTLESGWTEKYELERKQIINLVNKDEIEMYKGNRLMVLADMYDEIYPDAKWIKIERHIDETYRSRFGERIPFQDYKRITELRSAAWSRTETSKKALVLQYDMFKEDPVSTFEIIQNHLEIKSSPENREACINFFKPKNVS